MPDQTLPPPIELSLSLEPTDLLAGAWEGYSQPRRGALLKRVLEPPPSPMQQAKGWVTLFVIGFLLGVFHLNLGIFVLSAFGNAIGYLPPMSPEYYGICIVGTLVSGAIWFWLLAGPAIQHHRRQRACKAEWRVTFPEIFKGPVPVAIHFLAARVTYDMLDSRQSVPLGISLRLVDTANYVLLRLRGDMLPISKKELSPSLMASIR